MKHLVKRGYIDVWNLLLILVAYLGGLMFIYAITDQIAMFLILLVSVKFFILGAILLACLVRFIWSIFVNYRRAKYESTQGKYTFEQVAEILRDCPEAFENNDPQ